MVATTAEVKVVRVTGITHVRITLLVRRGTPVVTERSTTAKRSTKPTSSRKENTVAIGAGYLITINAFISGPVPSATITVYPSNIENLPVGFGLLLPDSSGSPSSIISNLMPAT